MLVAGLVACNALFGVDDFSVSQAAGGNAGDGGAGGAGAATTCLANEVRSCYDGPDGTLDKGACVAGTQTCREDGSGFGECVDQQQPELDDCSTLDIDEDCNNLRCGEAIWSTTLTDDAPNLATQNVTAIASDDDAVVVTGIFRRALRIGAYLIPGDTTDDGYVAKLGLNGNVNWLVQLAGATEQQPVGIALDTSGNVYVVGSFHTELTVVTTMGDTSVSNLMGWDAFILKLDPSGHVAWLRHYGGDGDVRGYAIAVGADDVIAIAGEMSGAVDFGPTVITGGATSDAFVLALDKGGQPLWAASEPTTANSAHKAVAISPSAIVVGGSFDGELTLAGMQVPSAGGPDGLLLAYDVVSGDVVGARHLNGQGTEVVASVALLDDDVIAAGEFVGTLDLGDGTEHNATATNIFVARYGSNLSSIVWGRAFGGAGATDLGDIAIDTTGEIALAGSFDDTVDWGAEVVSTSGGRDVFVAKLDAAGDPRFISRYGDDQTELGTAISVVPSTRYLFLGGSFSGTINFDSDLPVHAAQATDGFLVHLGP